MSTVSKASEIPTRTRLTIRPSTWHLAIGIAVLGAALRLVTGPRTIDDAYITFRYARNIVEGHGFVYNIGEPVLGTTTPLWALLLATAHSITTVDLPWLALGLNAAFDAASTVALVALVLRLGVSPVVAVTAGLLFAAAPMSVVYSRGGMEASLVVLLLLLAALAFTSGRRSTAALLAGLVTLARPEGLLAGAVLLADEARRTRALPVRGLAAFLAPLIPWLAFSVATFGSPIPQSMVAKSSAYELWPVANAVVITLQPGLPGFSIAMLQEWGPMLAPIALVVSACLAIFGVGLVRGGQINGTALILAVFPVGLALAYALAGLRNVRLFGWYLVPLLPFYSVLMALAADHVRQSRLLGRWQVVVFAALALWWAASYAPRTDTDPLSPSGHSVHRERLYAKIASDYRDRWTPQTVVAAPEIGALGYYSGARILDTVGLVSPQATSAPRPPRDLLASDNAVSPDLIRREQPDYLVSLEQFVALSLLPDRWFQQNYELIESADARIWRSERILIYRRLDVVAEGS